MSPLKTTAWEASFCEERSWKSDLWPFSHTFETPEYEAGETALLP